jgi:tetratricopeptide (TPR) repeat protein
LTENYKTAIAIDPDELYYHREYGQRLIQLGYLDMAYNSYEELLKENDRYSWCYTDMGYILLLQSRFEDSKEFLEKALNINNNDELLLKYCSFYYYMKRNYENAFDYNARERLIRSSTGKVVIYKDMTSYRKYYENDWQFSALQKNYTK